MERNSISQVEEAVALLRRQDIETWSYYTLAAVPLVLVVLAFARDMASGYGESRCFPEAVLCAVTFLWSSFWRARFSSALVRSLSGSRATATQSTWRECISVQWPWQALKLLLLPFAIMAVFPAPWASAFFRGINYEASRPATTLRSAAANAARRASWESGKHWAAVAILLAATLIISLNLALLALLLPQLLRSFTGLESEWTRYFGRVFEVTTLALIAGLTWLIVDPVVEAYHAVRCFQFEANSDGRDLLAGLRRLASIAALSVVLVLCARPLHADATAQQAAKSADLSRSMGRVLQQDEYAWARAAAVRRAPDSFALRLVEGLSGALRTLRHAAGRVFHWLGKLILSDKSANAEATKARNPDAGVWWLLACLAVVLSGGMVFAFLKQRAARGLPHAQHTGEASTVSIDDDQLLATDRPEGEWTEVARAYVAQGDLRLALRAFYLANLSYLSAIQLIALARAKTNGMYERELRLRLHDDGKLRAFARANRSYERAWFGLHDVTRDILDQFENEIKVLRGNA